MNYEDRVTKEYVENALAGAGVKVLTGMYTGNGSDSRVISLGVTPKAVIVRSARTSSDTQVYSNDVEYIPMIAVAGSTSVVLSIVEGGFRVNRHGLVNRNQDTFVYIAFV